MSNISFIREEKASHIGNFIVGRVLPFREKRNIGPFVFIDHIGPIKMSKSENFDIGPHPHIGLSTLTYLLEGSIFHHDSLHNKKEILPSEVNWMTAGKGITHSERTPLSYRNQEKTLHGIQIWIALPKEFENCAPNFHHFEKKQLPQWNEKTVVFRLIAGKLDKKTAPVPVYSKLYLLEIQSAENSATINIGEKLYGECGLYILQGSVEIDGEIFHNKQLLIAKNAQLCNFNLSPNSVVYVLGGEPFAEERYIDWNFVSSDKEKIKIAKENWKAQKFPKIKNELDLVPYPENKFY
jgi:redox-sensitive bicupin YhaK (pirin superfamily)